MRTRFSLAVLPGDGIGPEVIREAVRVMQAVADKRGLAIETHEHPIGAVAIHEFGVPLPTKTLEACLASDAVLLGAIGSPECDSLPAEQRPETALLGLRKALGGYANLRPVKAYDALRDCSPLRPEITAGTDLLIVRELLGGLYFGEPRGRRGAGNETEACNTMRYTVSEIERVAWVAFAAARKRRGKVTSVDKANILETSQLWREVVSRVGQEFPDVTLEHLLVDTCAMMLVTQPRRFDVLLTENLFGDILSDEAAVLAGSLGLLASATLGGRVDLYEPVHGTAPDIAGRDVANPVGAIATVALLLRYTAGLETEAAAVEAAILDVFSAGYRSADLKGGAGARVVGTTELGTRTAEAAARRL